ncbi:MAG: MFS transporter [Candidatus Tectomicrobia bacterium]|uniref:MFS transporter n=1 Tax=Tectimicrobiota bacterium TaxID=2528274 RepID=A0A937W200_UNCTE|nr:MFS transporter [Candidatus Tectomicrobia bacterium]
MQADILSGRELVNGIALTNTAMNLTSILGPALAGALIECCGPAMQIWEWSEHDMALALNTDTYRGERLYAASDSGQVAMSQDGGLSWAPFALLLPEALLRTLRAAGAAEGVQWSYVTLLGLSLLQVWNYAAMRLVQRPPVASQPSIWKNLLDGLRYSGNHPGLWTALVLAGMVNLVAFPLQFGLLPLFARDVFSVGAAGLGLLGSALGLGSLLGSFLMAYVGAVHRAGRLMLFGTTGWLVFLMVFSLTPDYYFALAILVLMGVAQTFSLTNMTVLLLGTASSEMRGRVMGLRSLAVAPLFLGGTLAGAATTHIGVALTTILCAVIGLVIVLWVAPWIPRRSEV